MQFYEAELTDELLSKLIEFSVQWEEENSCYGYRKNEKSDIEGNRIFVAEAESELIGYLFGKITKSERMKSIMPDGTSYFEVEELYVIPKRRSEGIGTKLFRCAEEAVKSQAEYMLLSTATKNWKSIFHFYIDELGMDFWSARLFKKI